MNLFRSIQRTLLLLFIVVLVAIVALTHFSISKIVAEQSRAQQQSISPALNLIVQEILKPLHVAETLGKAKELQTQLTDPMISDEAILSSLERLHQEFDMDFFIASEKRRRQFFSNGETLDLVEGDVNWYFKYRDQPKPLVADIGKWEDTHIYIDIKVFDSDGKFIGFFGVGKSLSGFLSVFEDFKSQYGYDFIFVNGAGDITLSSDPQLNAKKAGFTNLASLNWFQELATEQQTNLNNLLIQVDGQDNLIAEVALPQFDWQLLLLTPLHARQIHISQAFIFSVVVVLIVIFGLFLLINNLLYFYKRNSQNSLKNTSIDGLVTPETLEVYYKQLLFDKREVSLILVDIDNLTAINDTHGVKTGDRVLRQLGNMLYQHLPNEAMASRWGGKEFLLILPDTGPNEAMELGRILRFKTATITISNGSQPITFTASFGVSYTATERPLNTVVESANEAMYQAKRDGRNLVRLHLLEVDN